MKKETVLAGVVMLAIASAVSNYLSLPRMAVNEHGICEYFLVIENDKEVKKGCSVASKYTRYERFHVLSASAQEE